MSNISGQLIKDSFNYVLQSDLTTGVVYRIGGAIPVNPIFSSGLTILSSFKYQDGSESDGFVLTCDAIGNATWKPVSGGTSGTVVTGGTFDYSANTLTLNNSNGTSVVINGLQDVYITGGTVSGTSIVFDFNNGNDFIVTGITPLSLFESYTADTQTILSQKFDKSGGTVSGNTIFQNGLTATTISASTYQNLPIDPDTYITAFTYNNNTFTIKDNSGSTFVSTIDVMTGLTVNGNITATTISASTYQNLPLDIIVTGGTYNSSTGIATFTNNTGGTFNVSGFFKISDDTYVTGGTYTNGNIIFRNNQGGSFGVTGLPIGGAGGQVYYLNLSQSQSPYQEFSPIATTQPQQTTAVTVSSNSTVTVSSFQTPVGYPNVSLIPAGIWSFYIHSYREDNNAEFDIFCEVYKITTGGTETLLLVTDPANVTGLDPTPTMEISDAYYSGSSVSTTDRIVVKLRVRNLTNQPHVLTFFTEGSQYYSYGVTPFTNNTQFTCDDITGCTVINDIFVSLSNKVNKSGDTMTGPLIVPTISASTYQNLPVTYYYQNTAPTGTGTASIDEGAIWVHSETGVEYIYNYDGNSYQWVQQTLPVGPQGPQGVNGTNNIDSGTTTTFSGVVIGNGVVLSATSITNIIGYTPENVANKETVALDSSNLKYPTNNVVNTALQSFSDDVDYATMINQRILFNY